MPCGMSDLATTPAAPDLPTRDTIRVAAAPAGTPILAAGNGVVLKPSELTPLTSIVLASLVEQAGAPRGLVAVIAGVVVLAAKTDPKAGGKGTTLFTDDFAQHERNRQKACDTKFLTVGCGP